MYGHCQRTKHLEGHKRERLPLPGSEQATTTTLEPPAGTHQGIIEQQINRAFLIELLIVEHDFLPHPTNLQTHLGGHLNTKLHMASSVVKSRPHHHRLNGTRSPPFCVPPSPKSEKGGREFTTKVGTTNIKSRRSFMSPTQLCRLKVSPVIN